MTLQLTTWRLPTRRFTVSECYRMAEAGILTEDDRVELIEGEIIQMSPIGRLRDPAPEGYRTIVTLRRGESIAAQAFPGRELAVAEILR